MTRTRPLPIALLVAALPAGASAAELGAQWHAFSDVVHRGANLTNGHAALGASVAVDLARGAFAGVSGHYAGGTPSAQRLLRYTGLHAGWFFELGGGSAIEVSAARHVFGNVADWSYEEYRLDYHLSEALTVSAALSPDYYGRGSESALAEVAWQRPIRGGLFLDLTAGGGLLADADERGIYWGSVGLSYARGRVSSTLSFNANDTPGIPSLGTDRTTLALRVSYLLR